MVKTGITGLSDGESTTVVVSVSRLSRGVFFERLGLVSIPSLQCLGLVSVSRLWHLGIIRPFTTLESTLINPNSCRLNTVEQSTGVEGTTKYRRS